MLSWLHTEFVVLVRALLQRVSHAKRTCGPLLFVIGHTLQQHACSALGVSLGGSRSYVDKTVLRLPIRPCAIDRPCGAA